jgi:5,10-methylenetetrahydrofolate reductase
MSMLREVLRINRFAVTAEFAPPKGTDMDHMRVCVRLAKGRIHAANVTDFQSAVMRISSLTACKVVMDEGVEPVIQITGRDRNRIAIQGELLSAGVLGIKNLLAVTGDHPRMGDHPNAKPVYDLDSIGILQAATTFMNGTDLEGNNLNGRIEFFPGGAVSPTRETMMPQILKMRKKIAAGAKFFQTQAVFDLDLLREFRSRTATLGASVLAGIVLLKSANMARFMNRNIPGVSIPDAAVGRLDRFTGKEQMNEGIRLAGELIRTVRSEGLADGIHIMAVGAEERVGQILDEAGL